jgi:hypothetical protein
MLEKILQKLKAQRGTTSVISDKSLEDIAKSLVAIIATDEILNIFDFAPVLTSLDGNVNSYTAEAVKKAKEAVKPQDKKDPIIELIKEPEKADDTPEWAKALLEQNKVLVGEINVLKGDKIVKTRTEKLDAILKETPDIYRNTVLKSFNRATFTDEEDFNGYLAEIQEESKTVIQEGREKGLAFSAPSATITKPDPDGISPEMEKTIKEITQKSEIKKPF